jgi:hypothetical protein
MDHLLKSADEVQFLRELCDEAASLEQRLVLLQSLEGHVFVEPENQVVFESMCFLLPRGGVAAVRLAAHLNNRGFPDVDLRKYFQSAPGSIAPKEKS